jgi:hypothetical protein
MMPRRVAMYVRTSSFLVKWTHHLFLKGQQMKKLLGQFMLVATISAVTFTGGCEKAKDPVPAVKNPSTTPAATKTSEPAKETKHAAHGAGPHEGAVADWGGGKFHVEFTVDHDKKEATVYILGDDEKTPSPVKAKDGELLLTVTQPAFQITLKAAPQKSDPEGTASAFVGKDDKLGVVQEFAGSISGEVDGTPYTGDFKEEPHAAPEKK